MATYNFNSEAAKQADNFGNYIDETGKYKGEFIVAEAVTSKKGTTGIEFVFRSIDGREANYLTLWTHSADGKELQGYKTVNAIMACLRVGKIETEQRTIDKYDAAAGAKTQQACDVFPALTKKPIGVLLQREAYLKASGGTGYKLNIVAAFEANTELMAVELIAKKTVPEQLGKMVARLADKPLKQSAPAHQATTDFYAEYDRIAPTDDINW